MESIGAAKMIIHDSDRITNHLYIPDSLVLHHSLDDGNPLLIQFTGSGQRDISWVSERH